MKHFLPLLLFVILLACKKNEEKLVNKPGKEAINTEGKEKVIPEASTFFSTVFIEQTAYDTPSDGDLWPSAWSDDGFLYAANGDGKGFALDLQWSDIVSNKISGHPSDRNIRGERLSSGDEIGSVWGDTAHLNRKPTGMVSVDGVLYLAVQDLSKEGSNTFNEAPAASILRSDDKGKNWQWDKNSPMFKNHIFTTIFFLDYGKDGQNNTYDEYVYAYGMDHNWRDSFNDVVPDPNKLFLARIPKDGLQNVNTWEFYTGDLKGNPSWSSPGDIKERQPVLQDERRRYEKTITTSRTPNLSVVSQGSVVYNKPLNRYIYTSWTEFTFEFYESPTPWGPWKLFLSRDFGGYPWGDLSYGGYGIVIPSKFISSDGIEMWLSSSTFAGKAHHYNFSLRRLWVTPYKRTKPANSLNDKNLAFSTDPLTVTPISSGNVRHGNLNVLNDGRVNGTAYIDSYSNEIKGEDFWGYTWPRAYHLNQLSYTTGAIDKGKGGWFKDIRVQVRQDFKWIEVANLEVDPAYTYNGNVGENTTYKLTFEANWGDGIRIIGAPGGALGYISATELAVYYNNPR